LTQLNFINTLPCPVNISYAHGNHPDKWLDVGAKSFSFERDLMDGPIRVKANLLSPRCQDVTFSNAEWTGTIEGVSTKVTTKIDGIFSMFQSNSCFSALGDSGLFCRRYRSQWQTGSRSDEDGRAFGQGQFRPSSCWVLAQINLCLNSQYFNLNRF
jgi:hypothetical protein